MGQLVQRTYRSADGSVRTCETWAIRYYRNGRAYEESTKHKRKGDARETLKAREGDIANGRAVSPASVKLTFDDAAKDVINDYTANGKRSLGVMQRRITKHLLPYFRGRKLREITAADVRAYVAHRQAQPLTVRKARTIVHEDGRTSHVEAVVKQVSNAEINRELQALKRTFSLAMQAGKVQSKPHIAM